MKSFLAFILVACFFQAQGQELPGDFKDTVAKYYATGDYERIIFYGKQELQNWNTDTLTADYARVIIAVSRSFAALEAYADAAKYNGRALAIYEAIDDSSGILNSYLNLAVIHYYREDSARAYQYLNALEEFQGSKISETDQLMSNYTRALMTAQFQIREKSLNQLDSLLPKLLSQPTIALNIWAQIFNFADSAEVQKRLPLYRNFISNSHKWLPPSNFKAYLLLAEVHQQHNISIGFGSIMDSLRRRFSTSEGSLSLGQLGRYYEVKAKADFQRGAFKAAYENQVKACDFLARADSLEGFENVERIEAMAEVRTQEMRNEQLREELKSNKLGQRILLVSLVALLVSAFLLSRLYLLSQSNSESSEELAFTRGQVISILSHDLRTPLGQIKSLLDLREAEAISDEDFLALIPEIRRGTDLGLELLEGTVDWMSVNREDFELKERELKVEDLSTHLLSYFEKQAQEAKLSFIIEQQIDVLHTDDFLLKTVLRNICTNALKFTPEGGEIRVHFGKEGRVPLIRIIDTGKGMTPETLETIRSGYSFSEQGLKAQKGMGMGLIIVQNALARLGAKLDIQSALNEGTTFTMRFEKNKKQKHL